MIQNCLIRREMANKNSAADRGFRRQLRYRRRFFSFSCGNIQFHEFLKKIRSWIIIYLGFYPETAQKTANGWAASRHFFNFLF